MLLLRGIKIKQTKFSNSNRLTKQMKNPIKRVLKLGTPR
ncbi:hypothetical protein Golob_020457 [Gossypium lobatum]|uniref:Uncharacterized protein n=1 Tax=Gossypium lobatum TaxID=34289 RepID=A0A7J8LAF3_9ROSI|nr:hypothetical protein [Gossypium lobatum]